VAQRLAGDALAAGTNRSYATSKRAYARFVQQFNLPREHASLPYPDELTVITFVAYLVQERRVLASTVQVYLFGLQDAFMTQAFPSPLKVGGTGAPLPKLARVLKGLRRSSIVARRSTAPQLAITTPLLKEMLGWVGDQIGASWIARNKELCTAALALSTYGMLRQSEVTTEKVAVWDPDADTSARCVTLFDMDTPGQRYLQLRLLASKTDVFREGVTITVFETLTSDCPLTAVSRYLSVRGDSVGPLFVDHRGAFFTRGRFSKLVKAAAGGIGLDPQSFGTHSCRKGGASSMGACAWDRTTISRMGRWRSDAVLEYIQVQRATLQAASRSMAAITKADVARLGHQGVRRRDDAAEG